MTNVYLISKEEIQRRRDIRRLKKQLQTLNEDLLQVMAGGCSSHNEKKKNKLITISWEISAI